MKQCKLSYLIPLVARFTSTSLGLLNRPNRILMSACACPALVLTLVPALAPAMAPALAPTLDLDLALPLALALVLVLAPALALAVCKIK